MYVFRCICLNVYVKKYVFKRDYNLSNWDLLLYILLCVLSFDFFVSRHYLTNVTVFRMSLYIYLIHVYIRYFIIHFSSCIIYFDGFKKDQKA